MKVGDFKVFVIPMLDPRRRTDSIQLCELGHWIPRSSRGMTKLCGGMTKLCGGTTGDVGGMTEMVG